MNCSGPSFPRKRNVNWKGAFLDQCFRKLCASKRQQKRRDDHIALARSKQLLADEYSFFRSNTSLDLPMQLDQADTEEFLISLEQKLLKHSEESIDSQYEDYCQYENGLLDYFSYDCPPNHHTCTCPFCKNTSLQLVKRLLYCSACPFQHHLSHDQLSLAQFQELIACLMLSHQQTGCPHSLEFQITDPGVDIKNLACFCPSCHFFEIVV